MGRDDEWCENTEDQPDETYEPEVIEVQADAPPDRWNQ